MNRVVFWLALPFVMLFGCAATGCGAITPIPTVATCETACARASELGCSWADATPNGATCAQVCGNALAFGLRWGLVCRSTIKSCADVVDCH